MEKRGWEMNGDGGRHGHTEDRRGRGEWSLAGGDSVPVTLEERMRADIGRVPT